MPSPFHFLVVDDQPITRLIIITLLKKLGHTTVSEAEDGQEALHILQSDAEGAPVDFVMSDWNMPVMDGLTLLRTIRESADLQHLPVLMMTANTETNAMGTAMQAGADGYADKQFLDVGVLKQTLDNIMGRRGLLFS